MKIVHIFASQTWGGGEQYVYDLAREQLKNGHDVKFFFQESSVLRDKISQLGEFHELGFKGILDFKTMVRFAAYLKRHDVDIIHIHRFKDMFTVILAALAAGSRAAIVITRHQVKKGKGNLLYRWAYKHVHRIIFVSDLAMKEWAGAMRRVPVNKCTVIHNSIPDLPPVNEKLPVNLRNNYNLDNNTPVIMFTGRIVPEKGIDTLLEALKQIRNKNFRMIFVGTGDKDYLREITNKTEKYELYEKILWIGYSDNARSLMAQADIGVCPSIAREAFGLTAAEFMQAGKCVVTSRNGAQPEFIEDGITGILVTAGDADELAGKLAYALENKEERERIGTEARRYFEKKLSYGKFYEKIMSVYTATRN